MKSPLILGLAVSLGFIAAGSYVVHRSVQEFIRTEELVNHTNAVLVHISKTFTRVRDCESSVRGFGLTGDPAFLLAFEVQRPEILKDAALLAELTRDNPDQQRRVEKLRPALVERVEKFERLIESRRKSGLEGAALEVTVARPLSMKIRSILDEMEAEERSLLTRRRTESEQDQRRMRGFFLGLGATTAAVIAGLFIVSYRQGEARRLAEEVLQDLYDNAPCGYFPVDANGTIAKVNATLLRWLGRAREDVEGRMRIRDLMDPALDATFDQRWAEFRKRGEGVRNLERGFLTKDGRVVPMLLSASIEKDRDGNFIQTRSSLFDISDRRRAERDLDQFFETSLDLMGIASLTDGKFTRVSPSWTKTLGWTAEEVCARPWLEFVHPEDTASTIAAARGLAEGKPAVFFENRYRCKDGSYRWLSWKVPAPAPGESSLYAVARDVTDLKLTHERIRTLNEDLARKVEEALAANKELEAFSYSVSHDLRAPLRAIDGFSRLLAEDHSPALGEEGGRLLEVITRNTRKMGQLIDDLLQFSRLGRKELGGTAVDMGDLVRDVVDEVRKTESGRAVDVRVGDLPPVRGDRALLKQVWTNLVSNAFKYSRPSPEPRIEIGAERDSSGIVYHVRDNGVGFDMKYSDKLFCVFSRLHAQREFEGTGVGLAIVQRIVQRHKGRVWAESRPGEGAVFRFSIPAGEPGHA